MEFGFDRGQSFGRLVLGEHVLCVVLVESGGLFGGDLVLGPGLLGACGGLVGGFSQSGDLGVSGGQAAAQAFHSCGHADQAFTAFGRGPVYRLQAFFFPVEGVLGRGAFLDGGVQQLTGLFQPGLEFFFLGGRLLGLHLQFLGVALPDRFFGDREQVAVTFPGQFTYRVEALGEAGQRVVGLVGGGQCGRCRGGLRLQCGFAFLGLVEGFLGGCTPFQDLFFVGLFLGEPVREGDDVVGEQAQAGITHVGLDHGGLAGQFGLAAQRFELAAQLRGQVRDPVQVALHRLEFADRLFFAFAVFEDAGCFFDE